MNRWICIHGHFYQPPRENPWLEEIEVQDSAYPYHDWNERIAAECYEPNAFSRILDEEKRIVDIVNNYSQISFNFGPTLLSWLEDKVPAVYQAVLEADRKSRERFTGHGSAMAQAHNHIIMPLANRRDKKTQILWGIRDFSYRFGREPEGMWLPETAVDTETLEIMAETEIKFVILAPHQVTSIRRKGETEWRNLPDTGIDPRRSYACPLPSGKIMNVFFYDGPIAHDVAFGELLKNGEAFAGRLMKAFSGKVSEDNPLVHIATDGETFGHHNRFGDMALSYCLHHLEDQNLARITVYGEYLEKYPPEFEVKILENSSWSCVHGVERWKSNCGCSTGMHPDWTQEWRAPLREALDSLRDRLSSLFEQEMEEYTGDPWVIRDNYIDVVLDRSQSRVDEFLTDHARRELRQEEKARMLKLLEMQRNAMLMYTSCGWFFDEISGIETVQVIQYAARAIQLAEDISGRDYEADFVLGLEKAPSNLPEHQNGARIYKKFVQPAVLDLLRVGAHYAISSLFEDYPEKISINSYSAEKETYRLNEAGKQKLALGRVRLRSNIVWEEERIGFAVLHFGGHNMMGGVREYRGEKDFHEMMAAIQNHFKVGDITGAINRMDDFFEDHSYSLWHLFRDEKRKVMERILETALGEIEGNFRQIYEYHYPTIKAMNEMKIPLPRALATPVEIILNQDFKKYLAQETPDMDKLKKLAEEFRALSFSPDKAVLELLAKQRLSYFMRKVQDSSKQLEILNIVKDLLRLINKMELYPELWEVQNIYFRLTKECFPKVKEKDGLGSRKAKEWVESFREIGTFLGVKSP